MYMPLSLSFYDAVLSLSPVNRAVAEGEDANFTCSPLLSVAATVLITIPPGSNITDLVDTSRISVIDIDTDGIDGTDARVYTWLNATQSDHGRQFFCQVSNTLSNEATLYLNGKCDNRLT